MAERRRKAPLLELEVRATTVASEMLALLTMVGAVEVLARLVKMLMELLAVLAVLELQTRLLVRQSPMQEVVAVEHIQSLLLLEQAVQAEVVVVGNRQWMESLAQMPSVVVGVAQEQARLVLVVKAAMVSSL